MPWHSQERPKLARMYCTCRLSTCPESDALTADLPLNTCWGMTAIVVGSPGSSCSPLSLMDTRVCDRRALRSSKAAAASSYQISWMKSQKIRRVNSQRRRADTARLLAFLLVAQCSSKCAPLSRYHATTGFK